MANFFYATCEKETRHVPVFVAQRVCEVSRSTIYYWMKHEWVHWRLLPSGRRVICSESLGSADHGDDAPAEPGSELSSHRLRIQERGRIFGLREASIT